MISHEQGVGIEFEYRGRKCITLPRETIYNFGVCASVTTYMDSVAFASHFYATLHFPTLSCKIIDDYSGKTFVCNTQPPESKIDSIEVKHVAPNPIYGETYGIKTLEVGRGVTTSRFDSIEECLSAIESTFTKSVGGNPWVLVDDNYDSWEKAKSRYIKFYMEE